MRIIKLQDDNLYYCHLKKLLNVMMTLEIPDNKPNIIVIIKVDNKDIENAYTNNLVTHLG